MRKIGCAFVLLVLFLAGVLIYFVLRPEPRPEPPTVRVHRVVAPPAVPPSRGRPAATPDAEWLETAKGIFGHRAREKHCGPYRLYTDVRDAGLLDTCGALASQLDALYLKRYGVKPVGQPAEAIVLFSKLADYRTFARQSGVALGYAGYAVGARGLAIFHADSSARDTFFPTLTHELTHLVSRRALGVNLPPWLSEGLSDGIGDTATAKGFGSVEGVEGSEVQVERLKEAYTSNRAGGLARLVALKRSEFDRATVSFDYEQSAVLVRFLLSDPQLKPGFRRYLRGIAENEGVEPERLREALGVEWEELDRRLESWLRQLRR